MSKINVSKVIAGGILAGLVLAAFDFVTQNYLLADQWQLVAQRHNVDPALMGGTPALVLMMATDLVIGFVITLTYAGIRPRFGAGPATASIAAFLIFLPCALMIASFGGWLVHWDLFFRQATVMLVAFIAAGWAGGWIYGEEETQ